MVNTNTRKNYKNRKRITHKKINNKNKSTIVHYKSQLDGPLYLTTVPLNEYEEIKKKFNVFPTPEEEINIWMDSVINHKKTIF